MAPGTTSRFPRASLPTPNKAGTSISSGFARSKRALRISRSTLPMNVGLTGLARSSSANRKLADRKIASDLIYLEVVIMKSLGGSLNGSPSAVLYAPDRLAVFATQPGGVLAHWLLEGATWNPLNPRPLLPVGSDGGFPNLPSEGEGICAVSSGPGRLEVFAAGRNGNSPWWWRFDGMTWSGPKKLPLSAGNPGIHPVPVAAICSGPNYINVFAAGPGNPPNWWQWTGASWSEPNPLPLPPDTPGIHPVRVAAVSSKPGRIDVFAASHRKQLLHWWVEVPFTPTWQVEECGGNLPPEGVSAVSWGPDRIDVFAASQGSGQGPDGNPLQHWSWDGNQRGGPETLGGNLVPWTVSAVSHAPGRLDVFGISGDGRLARWQWDGHWWSGPNYPGGNLLAGDVNAVERA